MSVAQPPDDADTIDGETLMVLVNARGQHALWPAGLPPPEGWDRAGPAGPKQTCLAYVEASWRDMRAQPEGTPAPARHASA